MSREKDVFLLMDIASRESSYGNGAGTLDDWYKFNGPGLFQASKTIDDDADEVTGTQYPTEGSGLETEENSSGSVEFKANSELLPFFTGAMCANLQTTGESAPFSHVVKAPGSGVDSPWSFAAIQATDRNTAASIYQYDGLVVNSLEFEINEVGPILVSAEILGSGKLTAVPGTSVPAIASALSGNRLIQKDVTLILGPNGTEELTPGGANILRSVRVRMNANMIMDRPPGSGAIASAAYYGQGMNPSLEVELVVRGKRGDTIWNYWRNQTKLVFDLSVGDGVNQNMQLQGNSVRIQGDPGEMEGFDETGDILTLPLKFEYVPADSSPWIWTFLNSVQAYLQAA